MTTITHQYEDGKRVIDLASSEGNVYAIYTILKVECSNHMLAAPSTEEFFGHNAYDELLSYVESNYGDLVKFVNKE